MRKFSSTNLVVIALLLAVNVVSAPLEIVKNNQADAVIVTADKPTPVAKYASKELAEYIKKATGANLKIFTESQAPKNGIKIFVGATHAA